MSDPRPHSLRESALSLLSKQGQLSSRVLPALEGVGQAVSKITARWPGFVMKPDDRDRERLALNMLLRVNNNRWEDITTQRVILAAIAIFDEDRRMRDDLTPVRTFYFDEITAAKPGPFLDGMVGVYVESFDQEALHTQRLGEALRQRTAELSWRQSRLVETLPGLFSPASAPLDLADVMIASDDAYATLTAMGLTMPHASGLARAAHKIFVQKLAPDLGKGAARAKLFNWMTPENGPVLQSGAGAAVEALLSVWRHEAPPAAVRNELSEQIIGAWNDPRLHSGGIWSGFDPALKAVLLQWLTYQDMKFFCDMVTATQDSHMWGPRRDFWLKLHKENRIDEAWVAFGSDALRYARQNLIKSGKTDLGRRFARQVDRGGSTSLLIMRLGNKIVVDGCHSYKTHIFRQDDPNAPKLYQSHYYCDDIMRASRNSKPHNSIYNWSQWVLQNV